jgi:hypothetical protein
LGGHMEHRWGHRVETNVGVQLLANPASIAWGRLKNVSLSGGFIETRLRIPILSTLCMTVKTSPGSAEEPRSVCAIVVRHEASGVGVEWLDGSSEVVAALLDDAEARVNPPGADSPVEPARHYRSAC